MKTWHDIMTQPGMVSLGTFWSGDWDAPNQEIYASVSGRDRLELLGKSMYGNTAVRTNISLFNLATDVFTDAGLKPDEYFIDPKLYEYIIPYVKIENQSHREVLRKIAEASLSNVYCDRQGVIRITGTHYEDITEIELQDVFRKNNPSKYLEIANCIEVFIQAFNSNGERLPAAKIVVRDEDSIKENGLMLYSLPTNDLIQTAEMAQDIADTLLASFKDPNRNLELEWRGNPALLVNTAIAIADDAETNYYSVTRQELSYDGSLRAKLNGRRI